MYYSRLSGLTKEIHKL
ncbi:hypothetical protein G210_4335 [Candida maltosa Xu316]|uniref:Uncharacterized protein n=1 Tax=Candida maltosa (strain Xu316) TaxID=1245528 RepID=M3J0W3_CANMX|nr:hypothetical protein G210_4335 [Candida maltosa Xu316]